MKLISNFVFLIIILINSCIQSPEKAVADETMDKFINELMGKMTLEEKIGQLSLFTSDWSSTGPSMRNDYKDLIRSGKTGAIFNAYTVDFVRSLQKIAVEETRLHIPLLFGYDVIHGHRTIFPVPLAQASSWDLESIRRAEEISASEATAEGLNWTFAPMVDITRDPRWGRVVEGAGEDTWLGSKIAASRVRGFQGADLSGEKTLLACAKHFAAYGAPQAGRDYNTVDISQRSLYEWYLPPYKACVDAGVASVMTSFNEIAGVPSSSSRWLLTDILRESWKFNGFVVSDYNSINELIMHGVAADSVQAGELAINAGLDMDMQGSIYLNKLAGLIKAGKVKEETINKSVRLILIAKYKLGLFDDPYKYCSKKREKDEIMTSENISFARKFAANSCVLLKNSNQTLPIRRDIKSIAVIGPLSDSKQDMLGSWSAAGQSDKCITLVEGIKNKAGSDVRVLTAKGCNVNDDETTGFKEALAIARQADFIVLALGESRDMSGEAASRTDISLPGVQMELTREILKSGKPTAAVLFNGRPLTITDLDISVPAILESWYGGTEAGNAIADLLFGDIIPSGKLTMTFPRNTGQIPLFYNCKNTGRPVNPLFPNEKYKSRYIDSPNTPLYPFGYGLSYTSFSYSDISLNKKEFQKNDTIIASVDITNTGKFDGEEIAQLYIRDVVGEVTRPLKELKGFRKILIKRGETVTVSIKITPDELSYYHQNMSFKFDSGDYELFIGTNSDENRFKPFRIL
jgi:beta-glucosidase